MNYRLLLHPTATRDLDDAVIWIARRSPQRAQAWLNGARRAIHTLTEPPSRCPLAPENGMLDKEIRHLMYGEYRIIFTIDEDLVGILHVRHGSRRPLEPDEI